MTEERARALAKYIRENVPGAVAIATREANYIHHTLIPGPSLNLRTSKHWIVVANGTIIRSPGELQ